MKRQIVIYRKDGDVHSEVAVQIQAHSWSKEEVREVFEELRRIGGLRSSEDAPFLCVLIEDGAATRTFGLIEIPEQIPGVTQREYMTEVRLEVSKVFQTVTASSSWQAKNTMAAKFGVPIGRVSAY